MVGFDSVDLPSFNSELKMHEICPSIAILFYCLFLLARKIFRIFKKVILKMKKFVCINLFNSHFGIGCITANKVKKRKIKKIKIPTKKSDLLTSFFHTSVTTGCWSLDI
jgi:hypothetical protein